ncbi:MAG: HNH endonuclease [Candidatus Eisenbacteria bacterium]|uniref:HNH endonuclease n=1 Tax=Eiseniibacteriota bacterium TaxID=2212470 RepID=A0A538SCC2_UNCEI|nr:MAG: HNH endonuclease [Candidatus Eisenbacteria bacterium]
MGARSIQYHHIEPFSESQSHLFSNIVALCPNCHARSSCGSND